MGVGGGDQLHAPAASTPGKDPVHFLQEAAWAPGPVWTGGKSRPHRDSIPDRPARSQWLYRLSYPTHQFAELPTIKEIMTPTLTGMFQSVCGEASRNYLLTYSMAQSPS